MIKYYKRGPNSKIFELGAPLMIYLDELGKEVKTNEFNPDRIHGIISMIDDIRKSIRSLEIRIEERQSLKNKYGRIINSE